MNASDHPLTPERREAMAKTGGYVPCLSSERAGAAGRRDQSSIRSRVLPVLALNEVFFGESLSSRVSYLEVRIITAQKFTNYFTYYLRHMEIRASGLIRQYLPSLVIKSVTYWA